MMHARPVTAALARPAYPLTALAARERGFGALAANDGGAAERRAALVMLGALAVLFDAMPADLRPDVFATLCAPLPEARD